MTKISPRFISISIGTIIVASLSSTNVALIACGDMCSEVQWGYDDGIFDSYSINADHRTPKGIAYDPSGSLSVSPTYIDALTDKVEACITTSFSNGQYPTDAYCASNTIHMPIDRSSFKVKVVSNWIIGCSGQQVLPIAAPGAGCQAKGETPTIACPCYWRAGVSCPNIIITTPDFVDYKDVLIRFITGCADPWANAALNKCATPNCTTPFCDGVISPPPP